MRHSLLLLLLFAAASVTAISFNKPSGSALSQEVVISQVYGGGGNSGALFRNDFIELFNRGSSPVNLNGWAIHYSSAAGTSWQRTDLTGTLGAGKYLLIQQASGGSNGSALPTPDVTGTIGMAAAAGKVVLTKSNSAIPSGTACPSGPSGMNVIDQVGYGAAATCFEGAGPAPAPSATVAILRAGKGCAETDNNAADFKTDSPNPRNSASPASPCALVNPTPTPTPKPTPTPTPTPAPVRAEGGSVLIYPLYSSRIADLAREDSRISLTNLDPTRRAAVHLIFVPDDASTVAEAMVCLRPNQTTSLLASNFDPNVTGYLIAVAVDPQTGCPINFNFLIGDVFVKLSSGHAANLPAELFAALAERPAVCNAAGATTELKFDGVHYQAAPRVLAASNLPSAPDGNSTLLVIDWLGGDLTTWATGQLFGILFDDLERGSSFEFKTSGRQRRLTLSNAFPRTTPRFSNIIPSGQSGWLKLWPAQSDGGIVGAVINFNSNSLSSSSAFNHGRNLHKLTLAAEVSLTVPLRQPGC